MGEGNGNEPQWKNLLWVRRSKERLCFCLGGLTSSPLLVHVQRVIALAFPNQVGCSRWAVSWVTPVTAFALELGGILLPLKPRLMKCRSGCTSWPNR